MGFLPAAGANEALNLMLGILGLLAAAGTAHRTVRPEPVTRPRIAPRPGRGGAAGFRGRVAAREAGCFGPGAAVREPRPSGRGGRPGAACFGAVRPSEVRRASGRPGRPRCGVLRGARGRPSCGVLRGRPGRPRCVPGVSWRPRLGVAATRRPGREGSVGRRHRFGTFAGETAQGRHVRGEDGTGTARFAGRRRRDGTRPEVRRNPTRFSTSVTVRYGREAREPGSVDEGVRKTPGTSRFRPFRRAGGSGAPGRAACIRPAKVAKGRPRIATHEEDARKWHGTFTFPASLPRDSQPVTTASLPGHEIGLR